MYNFEDFQVPTSFLECSTDENKREYLTFDETLKIFKKKEELVSLVALGSLRPYFYWEGYLKFSEEMNLESFKDMFNLYDSSKSNESERMSDRRFTTLAYGCKFFRGYITPHTAQPYSIDGSFSLYEIYIFENFTKNGKIVYEYTNNKNGESKTLTFDRDYLFDSEICYSIHPKSPSNEFGSHKCVFLKAEVDSQRDRQMEKIRNNEKISKKDLFNRTYALSFIDSLW
ncbi:hypothetical protein [Acinetobacter haemolyticus]|uniref:hypothetical protein n=1 Tax=Acinetobacter haemolyticus TaxID=29430 RepID=UPI000E12D38F|nr:hypothetical protein [Acinetobacter haemolyticus]SUU22887.1 Uncharacterised protein [Acinetobacter haemolyticus]